MSMLSAQADKLRGWADQMRYNPDPVLSTVVANDVNRAADTIWDLRNENEQLRELCQRMWPFAKGCLGMLPALGLNDTESYDIAEQMRELGVEVD